MTRDFDLVRKLLIFFDEKEGPEHVEVPNVGDEYTESQVKYHCVLLYQAGLLNCEPVKSSTSDRVIKVIPFDLTWDGHEFLAKIRAEGTWQRIKTTVTSKGGTLTFTIISELAMKLAKQLAGLSE